MEMIETIGKYQIRRPLGHGALAAVYEGWDPVIDRRVAIKTFRLPDEDDEAKEAKIRLHRGALVAGRLMHPNIVAVFDYGETDNLAYVVTEFVDGPSLKTLLDRGEHIALTVAAQVMGGLLSGLQFCHDRGVVHRNIKPANVMLTHSGIAKIIDIIEITDVAGSSTKQAGMVIGTPAYMSPEQFLGQTADPRADIYSAGVLFYQLLTGERPFDGSLAAIMNKVLYTDPIPPSRFRAVAPSIDALVRRAMAKRPEERFPSAEAFAEAIRAAVTEATTSASPTGPPSPLAAPRSTLPPSRQKAQRKRPPPRENLHLKCRNQARNRHEGLSCLISQPE